MPTPPRRLPGSRGYRKGPDAAVNQAESEYLRRRSAELQRELDATQVRVNGPFIGVQATGSFTIEDGEFGLQGKQLILTGTDRATILGSGRLVISG
jgi:hypothetical protein